MNGYGVKDFIDVYSGIQVEAGFLNEILNFPQMLSYRDIRVDISNNDRYFFEGGNQAFIYASQYIFLYCF